MTTKQRNSDDTDDLYVVTENGEQCFMWRSNQLTYIAQDRQELPTVLANKFGHLATKLDLSYNSLTSFKNINSFTNLNELILDNNCLQDDQLDFKQNLRLKTLSVNKNKLTNLYKLISSIKVCFPNLEYLSLIGNPLCPGSILIPASQSQSRPEEDDNKQLEKLGLTSGHIEELVVCGQQLATASHASDAATSYQKYRHFIIYHLPNLRFLDSSPISGRERDEALRRCFWMGASRQTNTNNNCALAWQDGGRRDDEPGSSTGSRNPLDSSCNGKEREPLWRQRDDDANGSGQFHLTIMSDASYGHQMASSQPKGKWFGTVCT